MLMACADAGKHIFIEKPLASTPDDCEIAGRYCSDRNVLLQVGHQMRLDPFVLEIKRLMADGSLGALQFVQGVYTLDRAGRNDWRNCADLCPGGSLEQLGVHLIDVLVTLLGKPLLASGRVKNIPLRSSASDWGSLLLDFENNVYAVVSTSFSSSRHFQLEFFFDRGFIATDGRTIRIRTGGSQVRSFIPQGISGSIAQFIEFADCIEGNRRPLVGADAAGAIMDVVQSGIL
jgi:predicted dehydrogenase